MEKTLRSGKVVAMREATGLDDIACSQISGVGVTEDSYKENMLGVMTVQQAVMMVLTLEQFNGESVEQPKDLKDVLNFAKKVPLRDWNELFELYKEVNGADLGE